MRQTMVEQLWLIQISDCPNGKRLLHLFSKVDGQGIHHNLPAMQALLESLGFLQEQELSPQLGPARLANPTCLG